MATRRVQYPKAFVEGSFTVIDNQESYQLSEENGDATSTATLLPTDQPLSLKESLGYRGLFGVIGGSLWVLGILGFLTFLWFGHGSKPEAADATSLWRFIALHNYFPQTITICSAALRVAVSIQATICTSMIAALILEKYGAQRCQVAWLSIMRSLNEGPLKLAELLLPKRSLAAFVRIESWLTFLLIIETIALQFSSTLLLSDMNGFIIVGDLNNTEFGDLILYESGDFHNKYLETEFLTQPPVYAAFGEVQAGFDATPDESGVSDTGLIQRSLLPIHDFDARVSVRKAEGSTIVMSARSSCIRPRISATYSAHNDNINKDWTDGYVVGTVDYDGSFEDAGVTPGSLCTDTGCGDVGFGCFIPSIVSQAGWQTTTCVFDGVVGGNGPPDYDPVWDPEDGLWSRNATISFVITTNMDYLDWAEVLNETTLPAGNPYQEWQSYDTSSGHFFNITLCSFGFGLGRFRTSMVAHRPLHEPQTQFLLTSYKHSTESVQAFMGVKRPQGNHLDRNILDLEILSAPEDAPGSSPASIPTNIGNLGNVTAGRLTTVLMEAVMHQQLTPDFSANWSLSLCQLCHTDGYPVNPEISLLFSDTVAETGRAANALLSLMTTIFTSVYYTYLGTLQIPSSARVVATTAVETPGPCSINGCVGYITVSTLILLHVISVITITALYVAQVRYSRYGNVWHTIAQLRGDDLADILKEAHDASDAVVERSLKLHLDDKPLKLSRQKTNSLVEANISG